MIKFNDVMEHMDEIRNAAEDVAAMIAEEWDKVEADQFSFTILVERRQVRIDVQGVNEIKYITAWIGEEGLTPNRTLVDAQFVDLTRAVAEIALKVATETYG
jgi:hypothetical protein